MTTTQTQIITDEKLTKQAIELFSRLGIDVSSAVNMFFKQVVSNGGLPVNVELPHFKSEVIEAMEEAKKISRDTNVKGYTDVSQMFKEILMDGTDC